MVLDMKEKPTPSEFNLKVKISAWNKEDGDTKRGKGRLMSIIKVYWGYIPLGRTTWKINNSLSGQMTEVFLGMCRHTRLHAALH